MDGVPPQGVEKTSISGCVTPVETMSPNSTLYRPSVPVWVTGTLSSPPAVQIPSLAQKRFG